MPTIPLGRRSVLGAAAGAILALAAGAAAAQPAWPTKPVRLVVPFPPGGSTDVLSRVYADALGPAIGERVIVDNKSGAAGNIGVDAIAKAAPDGYTIGVSTIGPMSTHVSLYEKLPFDPRTDFTYLAELYEIPNVFVVNPNHPAKDIQSFIAWAKERPGQTTYGTPGNGTTGHLGTEFFARRTGVQLWHIPYRTGAVAVLDLIGGRIDMMFDNLPTIIGQIQSKQIRPLAVSTEKRWPGLPDVPTLAEAGVPGFAVTSWTVVLGPKGLPPEIAQKLAAATQKVTQDPAFAARYAEMGAVAVTGGPDAVKRRIDEEIPRWAEVVKASGAKVD
jgi:tripartite-type tricarboxylate transporter receptor subunit TctC